MAQKAETTDFDGYIIFYNLEEVNKTTTDNTVSLKLKDNQPVYIFEKNIPCQRGTFFLFKLLANVRENV